MPAALAIGGFVGGFSGTLINGGSIGQAFGMGFVGAFAGGVGGVAFQGLTGIARVAALTAIGATAGASGSAIMGGNPLLGGAAGAFTGLVAGAVGPSIAGMKGPGQFAAGLATSAATGAAASAIMGGDPGEGAALGAASFAAIAVVSASFQTALDIGRNLKGLLADKQIAQSAFAASGPMSGPVAYELATRLARRLTFFHYGYMSDADSILSGGLHAFGDPTKGAYGTTEFLTSGTAVQHRFSLPNPVPPDARYTLNVDPAKTPIVPLPPTEGGGSQVYFPKGVSPEEIDRNVARLDS